MVGPLFLIHLPAGEQGEGERAPAQRTGGYLQDSGRVSTLVETDDGGGHARREALATPTDPLLKSTPTAGPHPGHGAASHPGFRKDPP